MLKPTVTAVICTRNRNESAALAVSSVLANTHPNFELILVDQSPNEDTLKAVATFNNDPRFRYIQTSTVGKGRACNIGLKEACGEVVVFTDDDCTVPPQWLEKMEEPFDHFSQVAIVFCSVLPGEHDPTKGYIPAFKVKENQITRSIKELPDTIGLGASVAVRKSVLLSIGGFDNNLGPGSSLMSGEDFDITIRVLMKNYWIYYQKDIAVTHYGFRNWNEGRTHSRRDWFSLGAVTIKPFKCGYPWTTLKIVAAKSVRTGLLEPFNQLLSFQKPRGFLRWYNLVEGMIAGFKMPVIREQLLYKEISIKRFDNLPEKECNNIRIIL